MLGWWTAWWWYVSPESRNSIATCISDYPSLSVLSGGRAPRCPGWCRESPRLPGQALHRAPAPAAGPRPQAAPRHGPGSAGAGAPRVRVRGGGQRCVAQTLHLSGLRTGAGLSPRLAPPQPRQTTQERPSVPETLVPIAHCYSYRVPHAICCPQGWLFPIFSFLLWKALYKYHWIELNVTVYVPIFLATYRKIVHGPRNITLLLSGLPWWPAFRNAACFLGLSKSQAEGLICANKSMVSPLLENMGTVTFLWRLIQWVALPANQCLWFNWWIW